MKSQSDPTPFRVPVAPRVFTRALLCALCASVVNLSPAATIPIADPFVLLHNDTYYAYGTGDETDPDGVFHVYTSKNLRVWRKHPPVLRRADIAAAPVIATRFFWAPEVVYRQSDQKFYLFYTASNDTSNSEHLYVATADSPLGPFTNISALLPDTRAIDSTLVFDGDIPLLFFVRTMSGQNIIHSARLNSDWKSLATSPVEVLRPTETWENGCTEGPSIIGPRNGTYYLLYSGNWYDNQNYSVGYATSKSLNGPWTKYPSNPILKKSATHNLYGPGHGGPFWDKDGVRRYIFHSHASDSAWNPRHLQIINITPTAADTLTAPLDTLITPLDAYESLASADWHNGAFITPPPTSHDDTVRILSPHNVTLSPNATAAAALTLLVGHTPGVSSLTLASNATLSVNRILDVAHIAGSTATLTLNPGASLQTAANDSPVPDSYAAAIGFNGNATVRLNGASWSNTRGRVGIAGRTGATAANLSSELAIFDGASFTQLAPGTDNRVVIGVSPGSTGALNIRNASFHSNAPVWIGGGAGQTGSVSLRANASFTTNQTLQIGYNGGNGSLELIAAGASLDAPQINIGNASSLNLSNGTLATSNLYAASASLNLAGGALATTNLHAAYASGHTAALTLSGGNLTVTNELNLASGDGPNNASLTQSAGILTAGILNVGWTAHNNATASLNGGTLTLTADRPGASSGNAVFIGRLGASGSLTVNGASLDASAGNLIVGTGDSPSASLRLVKGNITAKNITLGLCGTATAALNLDGGNLTVTQNLILSNAPAVTSSLNLAGGSHTIHGHLDLRRQSAPQQAAAPSQLFLNGGALAITRDILVNNTTATTLHLNAGALTANALRITLAANAPNLTLTGDPARLHLANGLLIDLSNYNGPASLKLIDIPGPAENRPPVTFLNYNPALVRPVAVHNTSNITLRLDPPPLNPSTLASDDLLAYALIPGPDHEIPETRGDLSHLPKVQLTGATLALTFQPARDALLYQPQLSLDLQTWQDLGAPIPGNASAPALTIPSPIPVPDAPKQFLRLKILLPNRVALLPPWEKQSLPVCSP